MSWQKLAESKRQLILEKIPASWRLNATVVEKARENRAVAGSVLEDLLDHQTLAITSRDSTDLVKALARGDLTAVQVTEAFCKRAIYAHQIIPYLLDFDYDLALSMARELDDYFAKHNSTVGPLHGLPCSFKDQYHVKGLETTMGYVGWIGTFEGQKDRPEYLHFESQIVRELRKLGAIPYAKTTLVQTLRSGETNNNILGYLNCPWNQKLTAGGSSGGEGVISAFRGSAFGLGTDSGGSISMPAAYNGGYSFKPSFQRMPWGGIPTNAPGRSLIPTVPGFLGPSVATLRMVFESILSTQPWHEDATVLRMPWRNEGQTSIEEKPLAIGLLKDDGIVLPQPPMARALRMTSEALESAGHQIVAWNPPTHMSSRIIHKGIINSDGMPSIVANIKLSGEPFVPEVAGQFPNGGPGPVISLHEYENLTMKLEEFQTAYHQYWESTEKLTDTGRPVDAVIFPVGPHAAPLPGTSSWWTYTSILNVLDYCAVVIPVTTTNARIDKFDVAYKPRNELDKKNWKSFQPDVSDGAPVGVMIVGRRLEEEKLLAVAEVVVRTLQSHRSKQLS